LASANPDVVGGVGVVGALNRFDVRQMLAKALKETELEQVTDELSDGPALPPHGPQPPDWWQELLRLLRELEEKLIEPLWDSLKPPLDILRNEAILMPGLVPAEFADQFWSQVGQSLTGASASLYGLGDMLESLLPAVGPRRDRSTPSRPGEQDSPIPSPKAGVTTRRSALVRPRSAPSIPASGSRQTPSSGKTKAANDKPAQSTDSKSSDSPPSSAPRTANAKNL
jgi:hypothetical protein